MIFGKDKGEFDFDSFKNDVASAADPLVEAVNKYQPNPKKRKYKSPTADLHDSASLFFQAAADTLDKRSSNSNATGTAEASGFNVGDTVKDMKLDKKVQQAGKQLKDAKKDAKLDKRLGKLADGASSQVAGLKLDKKAAKLADQAATAVAGLELDKKLGNLAGLTSNQLADLKLDKKAAKITSMSGKQVKSLKLDKKAAKLAGQVKDLKLDKKASDLAGTVGGAVKDAKLGDVAGTVGGALLAAAATVGDTVKDAKLDKKASDLADMVGGAVKDAQLDKRLADFGDTAGPVVANVAETAGNFAASVAENVGNFIKDNKLDKKAAGVAGNVADNANSLMSMAGDKASQTLKDAKLDKKLADAQIPEKLFEFANIIPGVTVSNPKKAAKQFRKTRKKVLKAAGQQQKQLNKALAVRQEQASKMLQARTKDAQKFIDARRKDIESGKITVPFYEPPKKKGFNWGRAGLIAGGVGAVAGGLALNNARIWSAVPPLESKLPGENRYFRSRQGIVFYKETAQGAEGKLPVVFVHGIGAGNSSYEWQQNIGPIAEQHKVYAYDLLGFGNSDRPGIRYSAEVYIKQLTEFLDEVVKQPAYVIASSLAASYAVQVAYRRPELIQKLVLTSPTGINRAAGNNGVQIMPPFLYFLLRSPILGKAIYSGVASRNYIRSYMENQMFLDKSLVTEDMVDQYYVAAHQPGAEYPAYSFFTGQLNAEIGQTLGRIDKPVLMVQGREDRQTSPEQGENLRRQNKSASLITLEGARLVPHWEKAADFNKAALDFLSKPDEPTTTKLSASDKSGVAAGDTGDAQKSHDKAPGKMEDLAGKAGNRVSGMVGRVEDTVKDAAKKAPETASQFADKAKGLTGDARQKVGEAVEKARDVAGNAAGKVQDTVKQAADKAAEAGKKAQDRAGELRGQPQAKSAEADFNIEEAAKKLSDKFAGQANQEHAEGNEQAGKPKVKPLKIQPKTGNEQQVDAPDAAEYHEDVNLEQELKAHRETFIGDSETGAALVEDKDNNGVDDRPMGNS
jgi:pimeloyl-ACP methyl ester carboxylesterase